MDQFHALGGTQGIGQPGNRINECPLPLQGLRFCLAMLCPPSGFLFSFSSAFGHILTEQKQKRANSPFPCSTDYGYRHLPVHKTTSSGKPAHVPATRIGTDENGLKMERATRFELATPSLGSLYSTN
jgi:hypothetical protein